MFWTIALLSLTVAGLALAWPLLTRGSSWRATGLALVLLLPLGGALLYRDVGTPGAMNLEPSHEQAADFDTMVDDLRARLTERPEDLDGWLLLGRSLKSLQRFREAEEAFSIAARIAPEEPMVMVELAEAQLFASGNPRIGEEVRGMLETAVGQDPTLQKGLWLLGMEAAQRGDDEQAIEYWQRLKAQLEPGNPVAGSVQEQIDAARARMGLEPAASGPEPEGWAGIDVTVGLAAQAPEELPESAVLFVIVRGPGESAGPPLGVARIDQPRFPVSLKLDDGNAMIAQRKLSDQSELNLVARLSMNGQPGANSGDWESEPLHVHTDSSDTAILMLTRPVE